MSVETCRHKGTAIIRHAGNDRLTWTQAERRGGHFGRGQRYRRHAAFAPVRRNALRLLRPMGYGLRHLFIDVVRPLLQGRLLALNIDIGKANVRPARTSSTGCQFDPVSFTIACRKATSKASSSFTCQIAPTKPDIVRDTPISSS